MINISRLFSTLIIVSFIQVITLSDGYAQMRVVIYVSDAQTGIPVENANVTKLGTGRKQITDAGGYCRVSVANKESLFSPNLEKPTENLYIESFKGSSYDECLNTIWFLLLDDAKHST